MAFISNLGLAFGEVVAQFADRTALLYPEDNVKVTYAQLGAAAERLARTLWGRGLRAGHVAAFFHDKSPEAFAAMLACLRLGVIYTNLDPDSPWERIHKILINCRPNLIVNAFEHLPFELELMQLDLAPILHLQASVQLTDVLDMPLVESVKGGAPAYIMFTSGSTGVPKGAVMSHANLLWFLQWSKDRFGVTPDDVFTNVNPIYFDNSVFDFYTAVFSGASLVPLTPAQVKDARRLVKLVESANCTIWFSVPSLLVYLLTIRAIGPSSFPKLRKCIFGGEGFPKQKLKQMFDLYSDRIELENVYGPTECTCICSATRIIQSDFDDMLNFAPLGRMSQNFGYEVIPIQSDRPDFGELFLSGPQVGLGYYNDRGRTANAFIQNPSHNQYTDIGYLTGDLVERDIRGWLYFRGRVDFQVKHMGYRIELEEVETAVASLKGVDECGVVYQTINDGLGQIVAFVAMATKVPAESLVKGVESLLPAYMVPKRIVFMNELPKNGNGKIDRMKLKAELKTTTTI